MMVVGAVGVGKVSHLSIHSSIHPSIYLFILPSIHLPIYFLLPPPQTSLLLSLLGETPQNGDPPLTMGTVAYVSQEAWLFNATIRQNILMGEGMVEDRYQKVLSCACLLPVSGGVVKL